METDIDLDRSVLAVDRGDTVHVMVGLTAPALDTSEPRAPLDLVAVLDRSGSMSGRPVAAVVEAAAALTGRLGPDDRLAVASFADEVRLDLPLRAHQAPAARARLRAVRAGGSTNLSAGWLKGVEVL